MFSMAQSLVSYSKVLEIVGDVVKVSVPELAIDAEPVTHLGDLAMVEDVSGASSLAQVIQINRDVVSLQVFSGTKGLSTGATTRFLGHPCR
jgi:V/A-type H+-transporting ATPase subunit B